MTRPVDEPKTLELEGAFISAVPVPFDAEGRFVAAAQDAYAAHLASSPISGVAIWAHTGRTEAVICEQPTPLDTAQCAEVPAPYFPDLAAVHDVPAIEVLAVE